MRQSASYEFLHAPVGTVLGMVRLFAVSLVLLSVSGASTQLGGPCHQPEVSIRWDVRVGFPSTVVGAHADVVGDDCVGATVEVAVVSSRGSGVVDGDGYAYIPFADPVPAAAVEEVAVVVAVPAD